MSPPDPEEAVAAGERTEGQHEDSSVLADLALRGILAGPGAVIYVKDRQSRFLLVSEATAAKHGMSQEQMVGLTDGDLFDDAHASFALAEEEDIMSTGVPTAYKEVHETWPDRPDSWALTTKRPLRDAGGAIVGIVGISQDVTHRVLAEWRAARALSDLAAAERRLRSVLDGSPDAICRHDLDLRLTYVNPAAEELLGLPSDALLGHDLLEVTVDGEVARAWQEALADVLATGDSRQVELRTADEGRWYQCRLAPERDGDGAVVSVLSSTRDVTALKLAEQVMARRALTDAVTGLGNRALVLDRLAHALTRLARRPGHVGLLFVDLDHFKQVNDTRGHHVGDAVLVEVARRLEALARREDTVARLGGDEFVVLCEQVGGASDVAAVAARVVGALGEPVAVDGLEVQLSASVGAVVTADPSADVGELLRDADAAMYVAKREGRNGFRLGGDPSVLRAPSGGS